MEGFIKEGESNEGKRRLIVTDGNGEVRRYRFKMEGNRRQKGKRLIITKKQVESTRKGGG